MVAERIRVVDIMIENMVATIYIICLNTVPVIHNLKNVIRIRRLL